jgi:hypothetical protein
MKIVLWAVRLCMAVLVSHNKPPPILVSGEEEYKIEAILKHRYCRLRSGVQLEYLVQWKDYGLTEDSWEPEDNLGNSNEDLLKYKDRHDLS